MFFKVRPPVEPTALVHKICSDARQIPRSRRSRYVKRMTPMTMMGKATEAGLEGVIKAVLAPHFHLQDNPTRKVRGSNSLCCSLRTGQVKMVALPTFIAAKPAAIVPCLQMASSCARANRGYMFLEEQSRAALTLEHIVCYSHYDPE